MRVQRRDYKTTNGDKKQTVELKKEARRLCLVGTAGGLEGRVWLFSLEQGVLGGGERSP